jgi:polar amino acid transport system substrate-binding protein
MENELSPSPAPLPAAAPPGAPPTAVSRRGAPRPRLPLVPLLALLVVAGVILALPAPPPAPAPVQDIQPPHQWREGVLRVGVDGAYPPFALLENGQFRGHDVELARRLAGHLGWQLELVNIPFDGLYDALRVSRIDVIISALPYQEELEGTVIYSRPYFQAGEVLIAPRGGALRSARALRDQRIGVELGSLGDQTVRRLEAQGARLQRQAFDSIPAAVAALHRGELDGVVVDRVAALAAVRADPALTILDPPLSDVPYVIAMPYDAPAFARTIDEWLETIERDGTLARLTADYLG